MLAVISLGGIAGALARYGIAEALAHHGHGFPWSTFITNVSGCLLIGILLVLIQDMWPGRRLLRLMLGTGVLGGYTTFSTYEVDTQHLFTAGAAPVAIVYFAGTLIAALVATAAGVTMARAALLRVRGVR